MVALVFGDRLLASVGVPRELVIARLALAQQLELEIDARALYEVGTEYLELGVRSAQHLEPGRFRLSQHVRVAKKESAASMAAYPMLTAPR